MDQKNKDKSFPLIWTEQVVEDNKMEKFWDARELGSK